MQQIKVEIVGPKAGKACLTGPLNSVSCHMSRPDFGNQEYVFTLTRNNVTDQFLRVAISVNLRRVNQGHAQRNAFAQRFFLNRFRMSSLAQTRRTLTECRDDDSVVEFHGSLRPICSNVTSRGRYR